MNELRKLYGSPLLHCHTHDYTRVRNDHLSTLLGSCDRVVVVNAELTRLRAIVDSFGLTTADGVQVSCKEIIWGPFADGSDIQRVFVGGPELICIDEMDETTDDRWDLIENCYSTRATAESAQKGAET